MLPPGGGEFTRYSANFAMSPDGRAIAYTALDSTGRHALWVHSLAAAGPARLASSQGPSLVFWSPDNRTIGYMPMGPGSLLSLIHI